MRRVLWMGLLYVAITAAVIGDDQWNDRWFDEGEFQEQMKVLIRDKARIEQWQTGYAQVYKMWEILHRDMEDGAAYAQALDSAYGILTTMNDCAGYVLLAYDIVPRRHREDRRIGHVTGTTTTVSVASHIQKEQILYSIFQTLLPAYEYAAAEVRRLYAEYVGE